MDASPATSRDYPARPAPELPSPAAWLDGYAVGHGGAKLGFPSRNPYPPGSDEWRGYEFGVYAAAL